MTSDTIMEGVRKVLELHPEARDSYNWLWYWYCTDVLQLKIYVPYQVLNQKGTIPSVESITRAARKLWEEDRQQANFNNSAIAPSPETQVSRKLNEHRVAVWSSKPQINRDFGGSKYDY